MSEEVPYQNGALSCPVSKDWSKHVECSKIAMEKLERNHKLLETIHEDKKDLLSISASNQTIAATLGEMRNDFMKTILGKEIVPIEIVKSMLADQKQSFELMLQEQRKSYTSIMKWMSIVFGVVISVVIGLRVTVPDWFTGGS